MTKSILSLFSSESFPAFTCFVLKKCEPGVGAWRGRVSGTCCGPRRANMGLVYHERCLLRTVCTLSSFAYSGSGSFSSSQFMSCLSSIQQA